MAASEGIKPEKLKRYTVVTGLYSLSKKLLLFGLSIYGSLNKWVLLNHSQ